jgi:nucleotide-binding universal stress UspA family protein
MKVLVPIDGSEHSQKAVARALELTEKQGAEVTLMTVVPVASDIMDESLINIQDKLRAENQKWLDTAKAEFEAKGLKAATILEKGLVPANNIIRRAEDDKFDRIIMGSTGRSGLAKIFMGSTAAKVVAHAPCEVTIVR